MSDNDHTPPRRNINSEKFHQNTFINTPFVELADSPTHKTRSHTREFPRQLSVSAPNINEQNSQFWLKTNTKSIAKSFSSFCHQGSEEQFSNDNVASENIPYSASFYSG